jgi:hypothetical protein
MPELTKLDVLSEAILLIEDEERWTKHAFARDKRGNELWETDTGWVRFDGKLHARRAEPASFCSIGAMKEVNRKHPESSPYRSTIICDFVKEFYVSVSWMNDYAEHEELLTHLTALATKYAEEGQDA